MATMLTFAALAHITVFHTARSYLSIDILRRLLQLKVHIDVVNDRYSEFEACMRDEGMRVEY